MQTKISSTLQILLAQFNGQILIPIIKASYSIGIAEQAARNRLTRGKFPIPTVLNGSRRFVHIEDLAIYVESLRSESLKPKRGRPTKASKFEGGEQ